MQLQEVAGVQNQAEVGAQHQVGEAEVGVQHQVGEEEVGVQHQVGEEEVVGLLRQEEEVEGEVGAQYLKRQSPLDHQEVGAEGEEVGEGQRQRG